ncbi:MAG: hypothetical protein QOH63_474 [Acidobacteriota bacterium]|nr:hypothetical protein [Acidobacteriota bacterium]
MTEHTKKRLGLPKPQVLPVRSLSKPTFYSWLYPLGKDYSVLKEVVRLDGFKFEKALAVRPIRGSVDSFEILAGNGRRIIAEKTNIRNVWAFVFDLDDTAAARYAL